MANGGSQRDLAASLWLSDSAKKVVGKGSVLEVKTKKHLVIEIEKESDGNNLGYMKLKKI